MHLARRHPSLTLAALATLLTQPARGSFTEATAAAGLLYQHADVAEVPASGTLRAGRVTATLASNHAGAAAADVNGDGFTDLLVARYRQAPILFLNTGNGTFRDATVASGLTVAVDAAAFAAGDLDNDGDVDLFAVPHRGPRFWLFLNDGNGHFTEVAAARGADVRTTLEEHEGYSVSLVDYDRDGYLDVYVNEWGIAAGAENALHSVLLRNRGAAAPASFANVTAAAGLTQPRAGAAEQHGFASAWADWDEDGWPDLALVGDFGASRLYWNNGDGTFTDGTMAAGLGRDEFGMGVAVGDYDGDGRLDLLVTSIFEAFFFIPNGTHHGNKLYRNLGQRTFAEVAESAGVARTGWGWGAAFLDYDNDADVDLLVTNGMDAGVMGPSGPFHGAWTDPTTLLRNEGGGRFRDLTTIAGLTDTGLGKAVVVVDAENDGDEDVFLTQTFAGPVFYRNNATTNGHAWIRLRLEGTASNRSGIGAVVRVTAGGRTQTTLYNPTNSYLGAREPVVHVGLGADVTIVEQIEVVWPSGTRQRVEQVAVNQLHRLIEPPAVQTPPRLTEAPVGGTHFKDSTVALLAAAAGEPAPVYRWEKDGAVLEGVTGPQLVFARLHPADAGRYRVTAINPLGEVQSEPVDLQVRLNRGQHSVARWWNEALLDAIRLDRPNPPVHARNLYHLAAAMWDAFWPYHDEGWSRAAPLFFETPRRSGASEVRSAQQAEAISFAAYRVLSERFRSSPGSARSQVAFRWLMSELGYDPAGAPTAGESPAAVGARIAEALLAACRDDGANEAGGYADLTSYAARNAPLIVALPGTVMAEPNAWQPLALRHSISQNGIVTGEAVQPFVGVNALHTTPFALLKTASGALLHDPGPPPRLGTVTSDEFVRQAVEVIELSASLDPTDGVAVDISPGARFNHPLGTNEGAGYSANPYTGEPYAANRVRRGDHGRVLAEYWADGPQSETPPGHWNVIHNEVTDHSTFVRRLGGQGPELSPLEWDIQAYLALNGALHDAACAAWGLKRVYDSARPISMVRHLGGLGQSSDPSAARFAAEGLPLIPGRIELVTAASSQPGQRHAHLAGHVGAVAVRAWQGNPGDPGTEQGGVGWILAENWVPYQQATFVSPAFPGYVSGHSTFSRAAAEVLALLTGSPFFPGGLAEQRFPSGQFLRFEPGPSEDVVLQWATYYDAADDAGRSRLLGGIHTSADDLAGRRLGSAVGFDAFLRSRALRDNRSAPAGLRNVSTRARSGPGDEVLITGFVLAGREAQPTLVRTIGPTLVGFGLSTPVSDPSLELWSTDRLLLQNDDWSQRGDAAVTRQRARWVGAFALPDGSRDAAAVADLAPGAYTLVSGSAEPVDRRVALAEVYAEGLVNLSARATVGEGENLLITGFVLECSGLAPVLVRVVGPGLLDHGVANALSDPWLEVYRIFPDGHSERVAANDNWSEDPSASLTQQAARRAGAFALRTGSRDAARLLQLPAGAYAVHARGANGLSGVALAEVYHVQ